MHQVASPSRAIDDTRFRVLLLWILGTLASVVLVALAGLLQPRELTFADLGPTLTGLTQATVAELLLLGGFYWQERAADVHLTAGQRQLVYLLTSLYLVGVAAVTFVPLFVGSAKVYINQAGHNNYQVLSAFRPLVIGPVLYVFGAAARQPRSA